jgi:hypothetical protein
MPHPKVPLPISLAFAVIFEAFVFEAPFVPLGKYGKPTFIGRVAKVLSATFNGIAQLSLAQGYHTGVTKYIVVRYTLMC